MSLLELAKSQKQHFALGGIVAVVLMVLLVFGVRVSLSSIRKAKEELESVSGKIESADQSLARRSRTEEELAEISVKLGKILEDLPPERNYFSWATEVIYSAARASQLEVDAIDEQSGAAKSEPEKKDAGAIQLEAYSLRITARGSFGSVKAFLNRIEQEQPLARITGVDISSRAEPEIHDVQIFVQWPFNLSAITEAWEAIDAKKKSIEAASPDTSRALDEKSKEEHSKGAGK